MSSSVVKIITQIVSEKAVGWGNRVHLAHSEPGTRTRNLRKKKTKRLPFAFGSHPTFQARGSQETSEPARWWVPGPCFSKRCPFSRHLKITRVRMMASASTQFWFQWFISCHFPQNIKMYPEVNFFVRNF